MRGKFSHSPAFAGHEDGEIKRLEHARARKARRVIHAAFIADTPTSVAVFDPAKDLAQAAMRNNPPQISC